MGKREFKEAKPFFTILDSSKKFDTIQLLGDNKEGKNLCLAKIFHGKFELFGSLAGRPFSSKLCSALEGLGVNSAMALL